MGLDAQIDLPYLERAVELAEGGRGRVSPNPLVGAVIGRNGQVIGEGFHHALGSAHAEVEAIRAAGGQDLAGATLYVSMEPCCHHGRTPPCTDAILRAGIGRVVVASEDPSHHASGRGLGILRDEGVDVIMAEGDLAERARLQNQPFRKHARTRRPWVVFKSAMSLDGKVATRTGESRWISGEESRALAHRWRAECDAVAVGIGTALADDPQLTARLPGVVHQPRSIVFDSLARLPLDSTLVQHARQRPLTVVVSRAAQRAATDALKVQGVEVVVASGENEQTRVRSALDQLGGTQGVGSILLEGGPHLAGAFVDAGEVDEIRLFVAPLILGGRAREVLEGEGADAIAEATRGLTLECESVGQDLLITAMLKRW